MKNKYNPLYLVENSKLAKEEKEDGFNATVKYQRKYGFEMSSGKKATHNNEADAFKHTYWQAKSRVFRGAFLSKAGAAAHEIFGNQEQGQPKGEENMDLWNNHVGQEIGKAVSDRIRGMRKMFKDEQIEDYIAELVMQKMRAGDLITTPDDTRKFEDYDRIQKRIEELVHKKLQNQNSANVPTALLKNKKGFYKGFVNEENGTDRIYTVENVGAMSDKEYKDSEKVLYAQVRKIGLPSNHEMKRASSGGDVYVHSYTRGDGVHVRDYYRSYPNK